MVKNITSEKYSSEVENYHGTVLLDFSSDSCAPCRRMNPVIQDVADSSLPDVKIFKVNVENEHELTEKFGIMSIPTIVVLKNGSIVNRSIGVTGKNTILDMLDDPEAGI